MGLLLAGIVLVLVGVLLAFTDLFVLAGLGAILVWVGWFAILLGVVLAVVHLFQANAFRRDTDRGRRLT